MIELLVFLGLVALLLGLLAAESVGLVLTQRKTARLRAEQRLVEARLRLLDQMTLQRMHQVVREQRQRESSEPWT